jgi:hypothetical protein
MKLYRFDLLFSYWIFIWFLLYYLNFIKQSPKLVIILGIIENIFLFLFMFFIQKSPTNELVIIITINLILKGIPLYLVKNDNIHWKKDIISIIKVFSVFLVWTVIFNHRNPLELFDKNAKVSPDKTPMTALILDIIKKYG